MADVPRDVAAKICRDLGDPAAALWMLRDQERIAPQDVRRSSVRRMVAGMRDHGPTTPGLRSFAARIRA